jgi:hypothetical protein
MKRLTILSAAALFCLSHLATHPPICAGAAIAAQPGPLTQAQLDSAGNNGTVSLAAGTYTISSSLNLHSGETIVGAAGLSSHVVINVNPAPTDTQETDWYGFNLPAGVGGVTIEGLDISSNKGVLAGMNGGGYAGIVFSRNNVTYGGGNDCKGNNVFGLYLTIPSTALQITSNYFHDAQGTNRNWEIWYASSPRISDNLFYNINDGGHIVDAVSSVNFTGNYGTLIHRMGQEIQGGPGSGMSLTGNVFYDYVSPYNDSEGMSVCPSTTSGVVVSGNYVRLSMAAGTSWGAMTGGAVGGPNRFGYAIEMIAPNSVLATNTMILSNACANASAFGCSTQVNANQVWGASNTVLPGGAWASEPGPSGYGSFSLGSGSLANAVSASLSGAPSPPANTFAGPSFAPGAQTAVIPSPASPAPVIAEPPATLVNPTTAPSFTHQVTVYSNGSISIDGSAAK